MVLCIVFLFGRLSVICKVQLKMAQKVSDVRLLFHALQIYH